MNELTNIISQLGFPIAMCCAMGYYVKYITDKHRETVAKLNEQHLAEVKEITQAINNNTLALTKLCEKLEREVKE